MMQESNDAGNQVTLQNSIDRRHSFVDKCVGNQKSFIHQLKRVIICEIRREGIILCRMDIMMTMYLIEAGICIELRDSWLVIRVVIATGVLISAITAGSHYGRDSAWWERQDN
jgi:hypothetical protein